MVDYYYVTGYIPDDPQQNGYLDPVFLDTERIRIQPGTSGGGTVQLVDASEEEPYATMFEYDGDSGLFSVVVPAGPDVH